MNAQQTQRSWLPALVAALVTLLGLVLLQAVSHLVLSDKLTPFFGTGDTAADRSLPSILIMIVVLVGVVFGLVLVTVRGIAAGSSAVPVLFGVWTTVVLGSVAAQAAGVLTQTGAAGRSLGEALGTGAVTGAALGWVGALAAVLVWRTQQVDTPVVAAPAVSASSFNPDATIGPNGYALKRKSDYEGHAHMPGDAMDDGDRRKEERRSADPVVSDEAAAPRDSEAGELGDKEIWTDERRAAYRDEVSEGVERAADENQEVADNLDDTKHQETVQASDAQETLEAAVATDALEDPESVEDAESDDALYGTYAIDETTDEASFEPDALEPGEPVAVHQPDPLGDDWVPDYEIEASPTMSPDNSDYSWTAPVTDSPAVEVPTEEDRLDESMNWDDEAWAEFSAEPLPDAEPTPYVGKRSAGAYAEDREPERTEDPVLAGRGSHRADHQG